VLELHIDELKDFYQLLVKHGFDLIPYARVSYSLLDLCSNAQAGYPHTGKVVLLLDETSLVWQAL
jgi:hypothetical protein